MLFKDWGVYILENSYRNIKFDNVDLRGKDYLGTRLYSNELKEKIVDYFSSSDKKPLYIGIVGNWGSGKSTIVETVLNEIREENKKVHNESKKTRIFTYDAWKYEGDSFRRNFIENILKQSGIKEDDELYKKTEEQLYEDKAISSESIIERMKLSRIKDKDYKSLPAYIGAIIVIIFTIILCIITRDTYATTFGFTISLISYLGAINMLYATTTYTISKYFSPEQFYKAFKKVLEKAGGNKNIIFIDNIDRCDKEKMIETFKTMKGFFDDKERMIYIVPFDKTAFVKAYDEEYAQYYMEKIFDIMIDIKNYDNTDKLDFIIELLKEYKNYNEIFNSTIKDMISKCSFDTPREIINVLNSYITEYNIMVKKNSINFFKDESNLNYLMKYTIMKIKFPSLFEMGHKSLTKFKDLEKTLYDIEINDDSKKTYPFLTEDLKFFLLLTNHIVPSDYSNFYSLQNNKNYRLEYELDRLISARKYQELNNIIEKEGNKKFLDYLNRTVSYDLENGLWDISIPNNLLFLINLIKQGNKLLTSEEKNEVLNSWQIIFSSNEFKEKVLYKGLISFEDAIFITIHNINNKQMKRDLLNGLINNNFSYKEEQILENTIKIINELVFDDITDTDKDFINSNVKIMIDNNIYKNESYLSCFSGNISLYISESNFVDLFNKIDTEDIIVFNNLLNGISKKFIKDYNENVFREIIKCFNKIGNTIKDINSIDNFFKFLFNNKDKNNWKNIVESLNVSLGFVEEENTSFYVNTLNIYSELVNHNETIKNVILNSENIKNRKEILKYIMNYKTLTLNPIIELLQHFIEKLEYTEYKDNLKIILKFYDNNYSVVKEWFTNYCISNEQTLVDTYNDIPIPETKEKFANDCIEKINTIENELRFMILFESSDERFKTLINKYTDIEILTKIVSECKKQYNVSLAYDKLLDIVKNKDSILDNEFNSIFELLNSSIINKNNCKAMIKTLINGKISPQNINNIFISNIITDKELLKTIKAKLIELEILQDENKKTKELEEQKKEEEEIHE